MRRLHRLISVASVIAVLSAPSLADDAKSPSRDELTEQLEKLQARIEQLEANQKAAQLSPADVNQVVERVIRDADHRSKLLADAGGLTAGFDQGRFFIRSEDGNWLLIPGLLFQARYTVNHNNDEGSDGDSDTEAGFDIRRMRLFFEGHALTPNLLYKFQWESNNSNGNFFLQDAFARYRFADDWSIQVGQFWDGAHHEQVTLDQFQLTADRSFINTLIGGGPIDRVQGVALIYDDRAHWRGHVVAHDGYGTANTNFTDTGGGSAFIGVTDLDYGFTGRIEYQALGAARQYDDFTALGNREDMLVVGAGANFSQAGDSSVFFHTIDTQWENASGLGVYGAMLGMCRDIGDDSTVAEGEYYDWGGLVQAGYLITEKVELFGRYEFIEIDEDALALADPEDTLHELTLGTNYYWYRHSLKLTADVSWLPNGSPINLPLLGIRAGSDDQFVLRLQAQLLL
jgi:hypothetical protein